MNQKIIKKYVILNVLTACLLLSVSCNNTDREDPPSPQKEEPGNWCRTISEYTLTTDDIIVAISEAIPGIELFSYFLSPYICDINIARIEYYTTNQDGNTVKASGIVTYPADMSEYSHILSIQHGTMNIDGGPTDQVFPVEAAPVFCGEMVVMADYLGYGVSKTKDLKHTYMHSQTTSAACADMILAARQYLKTKSNLECTADSLRLIGYSQGGQATVATLFELQKRGLTDQISLVWSGAGPHDLLTYFKESIKPENATRRKNAFILYAIEGIINGDRLNIDRHNIYASAMFENGKDSIFTKLCVKQWLDIIGDDITNVLHKDLLNLDCEKNADVRTLRDHMDTNSNVNIKNPLQYNIHINFFHIEKDTYVPYRCSESACSKWKDNSELNKLTIAADHPAGGVEFLLNYMSTIDPSYKNLEFLIPLIGNVFN